VPQALAGTDRPFAAILMDIEMPRVGGGAACAALRRGGCALPIIAVSGTAEGEEDLRRCGFTGALGKPFTQETLRGALVAHVVGGGGVR
jgi:CheY-like chemotaxis protein